MTQKWRYLLLFFLLLLVSCQAISIPVLADSVYTIPKEPYVTFKEKQAQKKAKTAPTWQVPNHWRSIPAKPIQVAAYEIKNKYKKKALFTITTLQEKKGQTLANVNRWRKQIGLRPITKKRLPRVIKTVTYTTKKFQIVDMHWQFKNKSKKARQRILIATTPHNGSTWFFKLHGDRALIQNEKESFMKILQHVTF